MIELKGVTVTIPAHVTATDLDLRRTVAQALLGARSRRDSRGNVSLIPLNNVSLRVKRGQKFGVLGLNGSGKTTLLKTIAQIYPISKGHLRVDGSVRSFFNLGAGLDPLRSGYENILLIGMYYTRDLAELRRRRDSIIDFAGLGEFIAMPAGTYSAGMLTRLLFAIATAFQAEVLVLDEMIGAGDAAFIDKAQGRIEEMISGSACLVLASHSFPLIQKLCDQAIWLDRGVVRAQGPVDEVIGLYNEHVTSLNVA